MSALTITDLHLVEDPEARLDRGAMLSRVRGQEGRRLIVRCPDRQTDGIRSFRANDVAEMLRKHGRIDEIAVTDGGTIVASADLCDRRGELAVWTGAAIGPWHPSDILSRGLGGSETAAYRLAEELADMGWIVTLYGQFEQDGLVGDVMLRHYREFDPSRPLDALIGFRDATLFDERPNAGFCALWLEDLAPAEHLTRRRAGNLDRVCAVSHWHKGQVERAHPWIDRAQVTACRNGIVTQWFEQDDGLEREKRVVYSSSPDRGGDVVLECWPAVRERVPDATLLLTYPRWFEICADTFQAASAHRERLRELVKQDGVRRLDTGMGQKDLARLMRSSLVWVNPGYYTPAAMKFEETSCISAMEAQAAGLVVVGANWGALTETVQHGTLIDGDPGEKDGPWRRAFVDAIVAGLTDEKVQAMAQLLGPEYMREMDWRGAAEQLASMIPAKTVPFKP